MENLGKITIKIDRNTKEPQAVKCFSIKGDKVFTEVSRKEQAEIFKSLRGIFKSYIRDIEKELKEVE